MGLWGCGVVDFKKGLPGADFFNSFPNSMIKLSVKKNKIDWYVSYLELCIYSLYFDLDT